MKSLILSTAAALGLGLLAVPASAAPISGRADLVVTPNIDNVACRTVEKRVRSNGVTRITRTQQCDGGGRYDRGDRYSRRDRYDRPGFVERRVYRDRRDYREGRRYRDGGPRLSIGIN